MGRCFILSILSALIFVVIISHILHNFSLTTISDALLSEGDIKKTPVVMSDRLDRVFWFMQITDIHLSIFRAPSRATDFQHFCSEIVANIRPDLVLVSGDLTDGKTENMLGSRQYLEEWNTYSRILNESNVLNATRWLDIRGNHDAFNVPKIMHEENRFGVFGVQGPHHPQSYLFSLAKPFGNYSFIGLDACPTPGLKRPLNFFGFINQDTQESIRRLAGQTRQSNHTFWFGHYPTSTIISPSFNIREIIGNDGFAYFCGHLHTFMNLVPRMYTMQLQGFLELELGDWRDNRYYRVVAVDHDLVSFVDAQMIDPVKDLPIVLITNPKDARFLLPHKEPVSRIRHSTHIRILAWSKWPIDVVSVSIDNILLGNAIPAKSDKASQPVASPAPLFVLPWNASEYSTGSVHTIMVHVRDTHGNERMVTQPFNINGNPLWIYEILPGFFLRADHGWNLCLFFYLLWFSLFAAFALARYLSTKTNFSSRDRPCLIRGLIRLAHTNELLYPVLVYLVYQITCKLLSSCFHLL
ncbi:Transmembrane protein 62 [Fasciolopsis buskii]|uniref:Transmembrane protein 62 n=1 Tax=Fasciolopsis buskii TaxID=27845 RepID=A0A8E0S5I8_9TREM|nr:Transmembrane protein 62 [Fasciolopsis buski]